MASLGCLLVVVQCVVVVVVAIAALMASQFAANSLSGDLRAPGPIK